MHDYRVFCRQVEGYRQIRKNMEGLRVETWPIKQKKIRNISINLALLHSAHGTKNEMTQCSDFISSELHTVGSKLDQPFPL